MQTAAAQACALLKVLANPDRLLLMCQLSQGELSVGELETQLGIRRPTLSQQLGVLRENGLVTARRDGKNIFYSVASPGALAVMAVRRPHKSRSDSRSSENRRSIPMHDFDLYF
jgi:DNA-binding transcriptional ArsR family regulator